MSSTTKKGEKRWDIHFFIGGTPPYMFQWTGGELTDDDQLVVYPPLGYTYGKQKLVRKNQKNYNN